ncbi:glycosyltransferase family 2 protein [Sphaerotilus sp.]|uniref:glycosyltransferase n=1 Tax=Sphaerotilus sp. TaxID=2093942 RepID=UPI0034E2906B
MRSTDRLISICICTYKRPAGLRQALQSLTRMAIPSGCRVETLVVDNETAGSAAVVVDDLHRAHPALALRYMQEPTPGVSHARNRCLNSAAGDFIVFIDDDEFVNSEWLVELLRCMDSTRADAVFGPVVPFFEMPPTAWLVASGVNDRLRFPTGTELPWREARTGNVMLRHTMVEDGHRFSTDFARTGGEDSLFFAMAKQRGHQLVWCDEAVVHESVPVQRMTRSWVLQRAFMGGRTYVRLEARLGHRWPYLYFALRGLASALVSMATIAALYVRGDARHVRHLCRLYGHLGKVAARFYSHGPYAGDL